MLSLFTVDEVYPTQHNNYFLYLYNWQLLSLITYDRIYAHELPDNDESIKEMNTFKLPLMSDYKKCWVYD